MERIINIEFLDSHDCISTGDAIVEYVRYDEDGKIVNEIVNVFLPEYVPVNDRLALKAEISRLFHEGVGYNL